jgi:hypothetical protein
VRRVIALLPCVQGEIAIDEQARGPARPGQHVPDDVRQVLREIHPAGDPGTVGGDMGV